VNDFESAAAQMKTPMRRTGNFNCRRKGTAIEQTKQMTKSAKPQPDQFPHPMGWGDERTKTTRRKTTKTKAWNRKSNCDASVKSALKLRVLK
jgi:hypothetical protein